ncbi:unnamed protein product [Sphagnum troendelagicum]|uniref:Uncharacterized protein n=1 Tax=Sphagnum troendelagicum TaxID=128251 RepID=A0ABP0UBY9_9BRYO
MLTCSFRFPSGVINRLLPFVAVPVINCRRRKRGERTSRQRKESKRADLPRAKGNGADFPRTEGSGASGFTENRRKRREESFPRAKEKSVVAVGVLWRRIAKECRFASARTIKLAKERLEKNSRMSR